MMAFLISTTSTRGIFVEVGTEISEDRWRRKVGRVGSGYGELFPEAEDALGRDLTGEAGGVDIPDELDAMLLLERGFAEGAGLDGFPPAFPLVLSSTSVPRKCPRSEMTKGR